MGTTDIRCPGQEFQEFYDLKSDPIEANNLIESPELQPKIAELKARLGELRSAAK